jgi:DNA-directed RNA polymerase subunit H (RpoH/RPB5)
MIIHSIIMSSLMYSNQTQMDDRRLFYGARRTCLEMLADRGYIIPPGARKISEQEYVLVGDPLDHIVGIKEPSSADGKEGRDVQIVLIRNDSFADLGIVCGKKFGVSKLDEISEKHPRLHLIIIWKSGGSDSNIRKNIAKYIDHSNIELFDMDIMYINPTKHRYQAKFRLMGDSEVTEMLKKYGSSGAKTILAQMCLDDPINRYYGGHVGDVYEIDRDGVNIFYRRVCSKLMNIK